MYESGLLESKKKIVTLDLNSQELSFFIDLLYKLYALKKQYTDETQIKKLLAEYIQEHPVMEENILALLPTVHQWELDTIEKAIAHFVVSNGSFDELKEILTSLPEDLKSSIFDALANVLIRD